MWVWCVLSRCTCGFGVFYLGVYEFSVFCLGTCGFGVFYLGVYEFSVFYLGVYEFSVFYLGVYMGFHPVPLFLHLTHTSPPPHPHLTHT